jgi:hypothetical protein
MVSQTKVHREVRARLDTKPKGRSKFSKDGKFYRNSRLKPKSLHFRYCPSRCTRRLAGIGLNGPLPLRMYGRTLPQARLAAYRGESTQFCPARGRGPVGGSQH